MNLQAIQRAIRDAGVDGWLFFDHHYRDPLAYRVLNLSPKGIVSRRWYYFIPAEGEPRKLVHRIESHHLDSLPGGKTAYSGWNEQKQGLAGLLSGSKRVAMQYSPDCAVPYVSMVDAGTIELVRACGIEVVTSADMVQYFEARWSEDQLESHLQAGRLVDATRREAFRFVGERIRANSAVTEWDVQQFIADRFKADGLFTDHGPNVSANANASNPHYDPKPGACSEVKPGDIVLIDLWAKLLRPESVYYDITWMGYCGDNPPESFQNIFHIVREARDRAIQRVQKAVSKGEPLHGFEVDDAARGYITEQGFAEYFYHRTGHSIGTDVHGSGANMDNLETHDDRRVIPWTGFSIEPGIYLADFGVRLEVNVFVGESEARVTGEVQERIVLI
jgi:Xaa-Pro dipeptidase